MGVKGFVQELKVKVSPSRLFKALVTDSVDVLPKATASIKTVQIVEGDAIVPGCVYNFIFPEGAPIKYLKSRMDSIDSENCVCKFTTIEGALLDDKFEKISHELRIEASGDGGSAVKLTSEYHSKGGYEASDDEINAGKAQAVGLYKACEDYLLANPHVCAGQKALLVPLLFAFTILVP